MSISVNSARCGLNFKTTDVNVVRTDTSSSVAEFVDDVIVTWAPASPAQSLMVGRRGYVIYAGTDAVAGAGHPIGIYGEVQNIVGETLALAIGAEGVLKNSHASGSITTADVVVGHMNDNDGTITNLNIFEAAVSNNSGTISQLVGFHFPDMSGLGGTVTAKYAVYNEDAGALIYNAGTTYMEGPLRPPSIAFASLVAASALPGYMYYCTDGWAGSGGLIFSNGTTWLRTDGTAAATS